MMQIKCEFESLSEMKAFARELIGCECVPKEEPKKVLTAEELTESAKVTEEIINRAEAREAEEKKEAPAPEPEVDEEPEVEEDPEEDFESRRIEVRALLHEVNKKAGRNVVRDVLEDLGFEKFDHIKTVEELNNLADAVQKVGESYA